MKNVDHSQRAVCRVCVSGHDRVEGRLRQVPELHPPVSGHRCEHGGASGRPRDIVYDFPQVYGPQSVQWHRLALFP